MEDETAEIFKTGASRSRLNSARLSIDLAKVDGLKAGLIGREDDSEVARPEAGHRDAPAGDSEAIGAVAVDAGKVKKMFDTYPADVLAAFGSIMSLAKEYGTPAPLATAPLWLAGVVDDITVDPPEVVLLGLKGSGKTSVLEALLGHPILAQSSGAYAPTLRPLVVQVVHNAECTSPRVTVRRDAALPELGETAVITVDQLPTELAKRNVESATPVFVIYESAELMNMTLVDTPGLLNESDPSKQRVDELVQRLVSQPGETRTRIALCVEQAGSWPSWLTNWVKRNRLASVSFGVFTDARPHFNTFSGSAGLNKYLAERPSTHVQSFFVTIPPASVTGKCDCDSGKFRESLWQCEQLMLKTSSELSVDKRFENLVGVERMRSALLDVVLRSYRQVIPLVRQQHKSLLSACDRDLAAASERLSALTPWRLRGVAMAQVATFLHTAQTLLDGTIENLPIGYAAILGQTLEQERLPQHGGAWPGPRGLLPMAASDDTAVPAAERPLFGRQQMERLLAEFRAVLARVHMEPPSSDEVASAVGSRRSLANPADLARVVSRLVKLRIDQNIVPLVLQFHRRVVYNMNRIAETASVILRMPKKTAARGRFTTSDRPVSPDPSETSGAENRLFEHWVEERYQQYVDKMSSMFLERCGDEIVTERLIAWDLRMYGTIELESSADDVERVRRICHTVFEQSKQRIVGNVLLKCYNLFLDQTQIWGEIQAQINMALTEQLLEELFEVPTTVSRVQEYQAQLSREREALVKQDAMLAQSAPVLGAK
eukprot:m51a1_g14693 hypothetical protein (774) ;mRNA; f:107868-111089